MASSPSKAGSNKRTWATVASLGLDAAAKADAERRGFSRSEFVRFAMAQLCGDESLAEIGKPAVSAPLDPAAQEAERVRRNVERAWRAIQGRPDGITRTDFTREVRMSYDDRKRALGALIGAELIEVDEISRPGVRTVVIYKPTADPAAWKLPLAFQIAGAMRASLKLPAAL